MKPITARPPPSCHENALGRSPQEYGRNRTRSFLIDEKKKVQEEGTFATIEGVRVLGFTHELRRTINRKSNFGEGRLAEVQLPKALHRHDLRTPSRPSLIGDRGDRVCTATSSLGPSQFYSPGTVVCDEDLEAHRKA